MQQSSKSQDRLASLRRFLATAGPSSGSAGREALRIGQSSFSRLVSSAPDEILTAGRGRATRYAARRRVAQVGLEIPIFAVSEDGSENRRAAVLHPIEPGGFYLATEGDDFEPGFFDDLPWFLFDLRPAGFLGRLVPRRHPELELPDDVRAWSAEHCLRYLVRFGWDLPGNLICGEEAFRLYLAAVDDPPNLASRDRRKEIYPRLAQDVLAAGPVGSSAAGEHPKLLATRAGDLQPVLVKFSPPAGDDVAGRVADLLVAEHLALRVLEENGLPAARSELVRAAGRVFLEVERFDRVGMRGRLRTLSLTALDAEFVGRLGRWSDTVSELVRLGRAAPEDLERTRFLEVFGRLIANSDMHPGNLSFFMQGLRCDGLAPAYDMLPAAYAPQGGEVPRPVFSPAPPAPAEAGVWEPARRAATELWRRVEARDDVSEGFRRIAGANAEVVERMEGMGKLLPAQG